MFRLTPLRTMTRTGAMLSGDQLVEGAADVLCGDVDVPARPLVTEQDEPKLAADGLLVALQRLPGALAVDAHRCRPQQLLHLADVLAGQAESREQAERDRLAVGDALVSCGRLERVRERVAEVEDLPLPLVVGV